MSPYREYRLNKLETGLIYQDFIVDLLHRTIGLAVNQYSSRFYQAQIGESRTGIEIKHDEKLARTGNLWIELAEKAEPREGPYADSGIRRRDNSWLYVIGNYDIVYGFAKALLCALAESGRYRHQENHTRTSVGYLLPADDAERYAAFVLRPKAEQIVSKAVQDLQALGRQLHAAVLEHPGQRSLFDEPE